MAKYVVTLTEEEKGLLLDSVDRGSGGAAKIKHANILLAVDRGEHSTLRMTDEQTAKVYHSTPRTVYNIKRAFVEEGFTQALDRKKREKPPRIVIDGDIEAKIVALTCQDPPDGRVRWTLRLLAETIVALEILPAISHVAVGDLLKKTKLSHGYTNNGVSRSTQANL